MRAQVFVYSRSVTELKRKMFSIALIALFFIQQRIGAENFLKQTVIEFFQQRKAQALLLRATNQS